MLCFPPFSRPLFPQRQKDVRTLLPNVFYSFAVSSVFRSIRATSSLGLISSAEARRHSVSKFGCLLPFSIIVKCVLAMPAKPLSTSWVSPFSRRSSRTVRLTAFSSNCTPPPHSRNLSHNPKPPHGKGIVSGCFYSVWENSKNLVCDNRYFEKFMLSFHRDSSREICKRYSERALRGKDRWPAPHGTRAKPCFILSFDKNVILHAVRP